MKKFFLFFIMMMVMPAFASDTYDYMKHGNSASYSQKYVRKSGYKGNAGSTKNYYTTSGTKHSYSKKYTTDNSEQYVTKKKHKESYSTTAKRKYFLAHPFFQPLKGKFGSVTDFSYASNGFDFNMMNSTIVDMSQELIDQSLLNINGKYTTSQFAVKEDLSFGITDRLAVLLMGQYDSTKTKFTDWKDMDTNQTGPDDENTSSGLNIYGLGLQYRFVDNSDWIGMLAGYFQHQKDTTNTMFLDLKAGYKVSRTTIYGTLRGMYTKLLHGDSYGAYVSNDNDWLMLAYNTDKQDLTMFEGGLGVFSVLGEDWTFNLEGIYGSYDWHEQMYLKGGFGWQPGEMFALNLYGQVSLYDSAKDKKLGYYSYYNNLGVDTNDDGKADVAIPAYDYGDYKIKNYNEWKIGLQGILYF